MILGASERELLGGVVRLRLVLLVLDPHDTFPNVDRDVALPAFVDLESVWQD